MTTQLSLILTPALEQPGSTLAGYTEDLTRALLDTAPRGCRVVGQVAAAPQEEIDALTARLHGIGRIQRASLGRRELAAAWRVGARGDATGMVHTTDLVAPLRRRDRGGDGGQVVVTAHHAWAFSDPGRLGAAGAARSRSLLRRAAKYADALVVPTHALAEELARYVAFGDRVRVIPSAAPTATRVPVDADWRAGTLGLPERYFVTDLAEAPSDRLDLVLQIAELLPEGTALVLLGLEPSADTVALLEPLGDRVQLPAVAGGADRAVVIDRALAYLHVGASGDGLTLLEACALHTPLVHDADPVALELAGDAGYRIPTPSDDTVAEIAAALGALGEDPLRLERHAIAAADRSASFTWADSAERVWALHAEL